MAPEHDVEIHRLGDNCQLKRLLLLALARRNGKRRTILTLTAGILSLLSASLMSAIAVQLLSSIVIDLAAVFLAFLGGFVAVVATLLFKETEVQLLYAGAGDFLALREQFRILQTDKNIAPEEMSSHVADLSKDYVRLSNLYDRLVPDVQGLSEGFYQAKRMGVAREFEEIYRRERNP